jgi:hypothetical protein
MASCVFNLSLHPHKLFHMSKSRFAVAAIALVVVVSLGSCARKYGCPNNFKVEPTTQTTPATQAPVQ